MSTLMSRRPTRGRITPPRRILLLTLVGTVVLFALVLLGTGGISDLPASPVAASCVSTWIWHFTTEDDAETAFPVYRRMLDTRPPGTTVRVAAASREDAARCRRELGDDVEIVSVDGSLTSWARDRYVFFERDGVPTVLVPARHLTRPWTHGDLLVPTALLEFHPDLVIVETDYIIEGGDVIVLDDHVLLGASTVIHNARMLGIANDAFLAEAASAFGREVLAVGLSSREIRSGHLDMVLTALDELTLAVADPSLALDVFRDEHGAVLDHVDLGELGVFTRRRQLELRESFDRVALELRDHGFEVRRLPFLLGEPMSRNPWGTRLNWNNVLLEVGDLERLAFIPQYDVSLLDGRAQRLYEEWGYTVVPVSLRETFVRGGALRCLTNVMRRCRADPEVRGAP